MYYGTLNYFLELFDNGKREFAYRAESIPEYLEWKQALRSRLTEITGLDKCVTCTPAHGYAGEEEINGFRAEKHTLIRCMTEGTNGGGTGCGRSWPKPWAPGCHNEGFSPRFNV